MTVPAAAVLSAASFGMRRECPAFATRRSSPSWPEPRCINGRTVHQRDTRVGNGLFYELQSALLLLPKFDHLYGRKGFPITPARLREIYGELISKGLTTSIW